MSLYRLDVSVNKPSSDNLHDLVQFPNIAVFFAGQRKNNLYSHYFYYDRWKLSLKQESWIINIFKQDLHLLFTQVQWFTECDQVQSKRPVEGVEGSGCHVSGARGDGKLTVQQPGPVYVGWKGKNYTKCFVL